jgi:hypothetical protein
VLAASALAAGPTWLVTPAASAFTRCCAPPAVPGLLFWACPTCLPTVICLPCLLAVPHLRALPA